MTEFSGGLFSSLKKIIEAFSYTWNQVSYHQVSSQGCHYKRLEEHPSEWLVINRKRRVNILGERDPSLPSMEDESHLSCPPIRNKEKRELTFSPPHSHKLSNIRLCKADPRFHSTTTNLHCPRRTKGSKKNTTALVSSWPPRLSDANKSHWWCTDVNGELFRKLLFQRHVRDITQDFMI